MNYSEISSTKPTVGLGVLSWRGYDSLRATLQSYRAQNLFDLFDESLVFLPEMEQAGQDLVAEFGLKVAGSAQNLGILGGFEGLAQAMRTDYVLLCENDYALIENQASAAAQLARGVAALAAGEAIVWRYRHRHEPGQVWHVQKAHRYWPPPGADRVDQVLALVRRTVRPDKARKFIGYSVFYHDDRHVAQPALVRQTTGCDYLVRSDAITWSNNPFLINRRFFLDTLIPAARARATKRVINGFPTIETELNSHWWREQKFWIGIANPGLFTHARHGDRGY